MHQYPTQQQQPAQPPQIAINANIPQPPMPPPHQPQNGPGAGGPPIYVSSQVQMAAGGLPNSNSSGSVVYNALPQPGGIVPMAPQPSQAPALSNGPPIPPNAYGQMNGGIQAQQQENGFGPPATTIASNSQNQNMPPLAPPHNRMSNSSGGAPAPPPPPAFGGAPQLFHTNTSSSNIGGGTNAPPPPQPPAPPAPPTMRGPAAAAPPPPPPPPMTSMAAKKDDPQNELMGSLAAQLQQAKLKKKSTPAPPTENSSSSTSSSGGGSGNYGTIGRGTTGMASMMDEMAKTLARRRAQAEKKEPEPEPEIKQRPWEKSNTLPHKLGSSASSNASNSNTNSINTSNSGGESPRPMRKRFGSASEETILKQVNGDGLSLALSGSDLEQLKAEIVREMRLEMQKVKEEIINDKIINLVVIENTEFISTANI
uniref:VASP_tetra domain-containing protein n=1 Tax=Glossina pallidipes TaxID=7398 RepID=A0A1A9ZCX5_GLOPL